MNLLEQTRASFANVRSSIVEAMQHLWKVKETEAWKESYESFGEYVEQDLGISQGFASKLGTINKTYLVEGGLSPEKLEGIDHDKLYAAARLSGSVEEKLAKALTLSRRDLKDELNDEEPQPHEHVPACAVCHIRL